VSALQRDRPKRVRVWLGRPDAAELIGETPSEVEIDPWDGASVPPESLQDVEFYVVPFLPREDVVLEVLPTLPKLAVVQVPVAGYEDVIGLLRNGVTLCNARGVHADTTAEWVVAAMLATIRDFPAFVREQAAGVQRKRRGDALVGKRVLIVGYGSIGAAVERRLAGFGVEVVRVARHARHGVHGPDALPQLLPEADVVVIQVPGSIETRHLVNVEFLAQMRDGALLVNAARGSVVDQDALAAEVASGRIRAALDVGDPDPLPPDHPLLALPGIFYTPHQAGNTRLDVPMAYAFIGEQLRRFVHGESLMNVIER
jgi:phosphoglycerate dehydrogenase-like enzyme